MYTEFTAVMNFKLFLLLWLVNYSSAQDANCDFYQQVNVGTVYYVVSPNYPGFYTPGQQCRWIATCPQGYNCRLECPAIELPQSPSCSVDRLLVSRSGDPQLNAADTYCGRGSLTAISTGQTISIGLITNRSSSGGRFRCQLTAQAATTPNTCSCGVRRQLRIVGGNETGVNEYPMMVAIADVRISEIKCGGVIISDRYVLSAAHCINGQSVSNFALVVGEHDVTIGDSSATRAYRIEQFLIHPQFTESNYDYDIAILRSASRIEFSEYVGPACLPFKFNTDFAGRKVTILGWGTKFFGGPKSNVLLKADVDVISQSVCRNQIQVTDRQMCTYTPGKDACQDDSGGPVLYTDPATGLLFNVGIISFGSSCASGPGVNTRVTALLNWILSNTPEVSYCRK
ncbi:venom serine protease 34-like isoform X3 [Helicoverpa zea]|uniref:venom serine protease 34-like isoform X3 n=1 Tax=Helicoverpa zea TaxID=7113 RepID=UPI001F576403|nr:venom serine protease 34-like isoform X3 [Helicoverpa zea]